MWLSKRFLPTGDRGFTIIELLVAVGILGLVAGVGVQIFLSVASSFAKSAIISDLQQQGGRVVAEISRVIRDSESVEKIIVGDTSNPLCAAGNGMIKITLSKESIEYNSNGNCKTVVYCKVNQTSAHNNYLVKKLESCQGAAVGGGNLTNQDLYTGVDVESLNFDVTGGTGQPYLVNIDLKLKQALNAPQRKAYEAEVEIKNSVTTRNF